MMALRAMKKNVHMTGLWLLPKPLTKQLEENGIIIAPVGPLFSQSMIKGIKKNGSLKTFNLGSFVFVPLKGKYGY